MMVKGFGLGRNILAAGEEDIARERSKQVGGLIEEGSPQPIQRAARRSGRSAVR